MPGRSRSRGQGHRGGGMRRRRAARPWSIPSRSPGQRQGGDQRRRLIRQIHTGGASSRPPRAQVCHRHRRRWGGPSRSPAAHPGPQGPGTSRRRRGSGQPAVGPHDLASVAGRTGGPAARAVAGQAQAARPRGRTHHPGGCRDWPRLPRGLPPGALRPTGALSACRARERVPNPAARHAFSAPHIHRRNPSSR